jgi:hypothetical protein
MTKPYYFTTAIFFTINLFICTDLVAQDILPPAPAWKGKSETLVVRKNDPWITPAEASDFSLTPDYNETFQWLHKLAASTGLVKIVSIGKSAEARDINMVIVSSDGSFEKSSLVNSSKPLLLVQAGIHAGEIDGKDAGLMLLRDIVTGKKLKLIENVNILFIPILNVDGHERISPFNRVNQRGPSNMGWRTNARNLNLNRDYSKLDTEEIRAVVGVMNDYQPDLYLDLHVTDGADYQYDITYGFSEGYSPAISKWLRRSLTPKANEDLKKMGHIPGPLVFAANDRDFKDGMIEYAYSARFSNNYGDVRHLPSILVENHSLKPFRQRVLGTYVFLESVINALADHGKSLQQAIEEDRASSKTEVVLTWKRSAKPDSIKFLGIRSERKPSAVTAKDYIVWTAQPITETIPFIRHNAPDVSVKKPRAYVVPSTHKDVIERLRLHGIVMEQLTAPTTLDVRMYRITESTFARGPFEGHVSVSVKATHEKASATFHPGSVRISTSQPLGDLVVHLLEPESADSFLQWGFFNEIFNRTEYIEEYAIEPLAQKMLAADPALKSAFESEKKKDPDFAKNPQKVYEWFYSKSPYVDTRYLLYPVGIED